MSNAYLLKSLSIVCVLSACSGSPIPGEAIDASDLTASVEGNLSLLTVEGLSYRSAGIRGITTAGGGYQVAEGEGVIFSIGDLEFPEVLAAESISPFDLGGSDDVQNQRAINIVRLLLALDVDQNPDNGIQISESAASLTGGLTANWGEDNFDNMVVNFVSNGGGSGVLPDKQTALKFLSVALGASDSCVSHPRESQVAALMPRAHAVAGSVTIVDDCTLLISHFSYDGGGLPDVRFLGTNSNSFATGYALGENLFGQGFNNATFVVNLNDRLSTEIQAISFWCFGVGVSFGDAVFE